MATDHRAELARIHRFDQLIRYLRDEMGWPIASDDFEELTFDYTAEELGINAESAAKIQEIKRLRPLSAQQPWGIFFVKFEPKNLPVVALRRILSQVALKKRASANAADRAGWAADDLLFVSNYGQDGERKISFAHFAKPSGREDLPTLKVLGWDNQDTPLHLDAIAKELTENLAWPENENDIDTWRKRWRSAFTLKYREVITTSERLSIRLAQLARAVRNRITTALVIETDKGPLTNLMKAFQSALMHDLDAEGFADMYAQTIAYGLLSARIADPTKKTADDFTAHMRTNPFLRELMETFLRVGGRKGKIDDRDRNCGIDFDELGVSEVVELLDEANIEAVIQDFGDRNPQEDPVIHFYELFLKEYDAKKRMQRGVFYTPRPVVSYIVRLLDDSLRNEFGLADGLADTTTWGDMVRRQKGLKIPEGATPEQDFVQILDPATGTGTFLVEVINLIHKTLVDKWRAQGLGDKKIDALWNEYVPKHLLTRLHGYELLMAPYTIAHLKIGLKLHETGYRFDSDERARIYLTNALEPAQDFSGQFEFTVPALAHESLAANLVKREHQFTVVVGNPPYASISSNMNEWMRTAVNDYLMIDGARVEEKSNRNHLQNDYIKFIRLADMICDRAGLATFAYITSNSYLDGRTLRGIRWNLMQRYDLFVTNLYGDSNKRNLSHGDENVFEITEGVAVLSAVKKVFSEAIRFKYAEIQGLREFKYEKLSGAIAEIPRQVIKPSPPHFLFRPIDDLKTAEYSTLGPALNELFSVSGAGMKTNRDAFATDEDIEVLLNRMHEFAGTELTDEQIREKYDLKDNYQWKLPKARVKFRLRPVDPSLVLPLTYRPFDERFVYYDKAVVFNPRTQIMSHLSSGTNVALISIGQNESLVFNHAFVSKKLVEAKTGTHYGASVVFPLYLYTATSDAGDELFTMAEEHRSNLTPAAEPLLQLAKQYSPATALSRYDIIVFRYVYAVLYSTAYRRRYAEQFLTDFPRIPVRPNPLVFEALVKFGEELIALHLLESPKVKGQSTKYAGDESPLVEKVSWSNDGVWINKAQTNGFEGVNEGVWNFRIGGYQICEKWLKDRKGRTLSKDDIAHYQEIVVALSETIRLMEEIDTVIEKCGGWTEAFLAN